MNKIGGRIRQAGLKVTTNRLVIYQLMQEMRHSSVEELVGRLQEIYPGISISTVYRILDSFCEVNLLSKVNHPNGKVYYDIVSEEHHHIFHPDNCIEDFQDDDLTALIKQRVRGKIAAGEEIETISIQVITKKKK